jgi:rhodanese-related sulfurtransferase
MTTDNQVYTTISAAEAKEKIDGGAASVDTRPPADWAGGHVPGAQNLPLISIRGRYREIPEGVDVIFVCQDGTKSPQAAEQAKGLGVEKVFVLDGGVNAWVAAGNGLETIN